MLPFDRVLIFLGSPSANCQIAQIHLLVWQHPRRLLLANWSALLSPPSPCSLRSQDTSWLLPKLFPLPRGLLYISKAPVKYHLLQAVLLHLLRFLPSFCPSLIKPLSCPSTTPEAPNFPPSQHLPHCRPSQPHLLWCFPSLLWSVHTGSLCSFPLSAGLCTGCVSLLPGMLLSPHIPAVPHLNCSFLAPCSFLTLPSFTSGT